VVSGLLCAILNESRGSRDGKVFLFQYHCSIEPFECFSSVWVQYTTQVRILDSDEEVNKSDSELTDPAISFRQQYPLDR
jgi:hypothetical protein